MNQTFSAFPNAKIVIGKEEMKKYQHLPELYFPETCKGLSLPMEVFAQSEEIQLQWVKTHAPKNILEALERERGKSRVQISDSFYIQLIENFALIISREELLKSIPFPSRENYGKDIVGFKTHLLAYLCSYALKKALEGQTEYVLYPNSTELQKKTWILHQHKSTLQCYFTSQ